MTSITVEVPNELAEAARALDPQRLTTLMCEVLVRETSATADHYDPTPDDVRSMNEALLSLAGAAGPGLPEDFADNHDHYIHGAPKADQEVPSDSRPLFKDLMRFAGSIPGLPEDFAENHDHYIHGAVKR